LVLSRVKADVVVRMQVQSSVRVFPAWDEDAQDLVKLRSEVEAVHLVEAERPHSARLRLARLSIPQHERPHLVDCAYLKKLFDQRPEDI